MTATDAQSRTRVDLRRYAALVATDADSPCSQCLSRWWQDRRAAAGEPVSASVPPLLQHVEEMLFAKPLFASDRNAVVFDRLTGEVTHHALITHPACTSCKRSSVRRPEEIRDELMVPGELDDAHWRIRPIDTAALKRELVEPTWGPVLGVMHEDDSEACLVRVPVNLPNQSTFIAGYGRGSTFQQSEGPALVEALERLVSAAPVEPTTTVEKAAFETVSDRALDPRQLGTHEPSYVGHPRSTLVPFDARIQTTWVPSWSTLERRSLLVPAHVAYWRVHDHMPKFVYSSSSGTATGGSLAEAVLYALFEVIERDAFLLMWHAQVPLRQVAWRHLARAAELGQQLERRGMRLKVLDATTDFGVAVSVAVITADPGTVRLGGNRALSVAAGAHFDHDIATMAAIDEAANNALMYPRWSRDMPAHFDPERFRPMLDDYSLVDVLEDHEGLFGLNEARPLWTFMDGDEAEAETPRSTTATHDLPTVVTTLIEALHNQKMDVIITDQTQIPANQHGLHTVRVTVPELLPMTFGHVHARIHDSQRLLNAHHHLLAAADIGDVPSAPVPHPFP